MKKIHLYLLLCVVAFTTGCPNEPSKSFDKNRDALANNVNKYLNDAQTAYNEAVDDDDLPKARRIRNDALEDALAIIDSNYNDFINKLDSRRSTTEFVADLVELGTGAATGITKGERPNQILGIALTAFRGGRRSSELSFYKQQTTPILIAKMDDNRAQKYAGILVKKGKGVDEYSMKEAIKDMVAYYNAGTLIRAFTELSKDTAAKAQESEAVVRELNGENVTISSIPTIERENLSDAIFAQRVSLTTQLRTAQAEANKIPIPTAAIPAAPTAAETTAINDAKAKRVEALKTIRGRLETIWGEVEAQDKFAPAVTEMKSQANFTAILAKRQSAPETMTEDDYRKLIDGLTAKIKENNELSKELLSILRKANK